jgi:hypothetical protein
LIQHSNPGGIKEEIFREGTNLTDQNYFVVLNNVVIVEIDSGMGINIDSIQFEYVDIMKVWKWPDIPSKILK